MYSLGFDYNKSIKNITDESDAESYLQFVTQNMLGVLYEFQKYTKKPNIDLIGDGSCFSIVPIYAATEELA